MKNSKSSDKAREALAQAILTCGYAQMDEDEYVYYWRDADRITRNTCYMQADALISALHHDDIVIAQRYELAEEIQEVVFEYLSKISGHEPRST